MERVSDQARDRAIECSSDRVIERSSDRASDGVIDRKMRDPPIGSSLCFVANKYLFRRFPKQHMFVMQFRSCDGHTNEYGIFAQSLHLCSKQKMEIRSQIENKEGSALPPTSQLWISFCEFELVWRISGISESAIGSIWFLCVDWYRTSPQYGLEVDL